METCFCLNKIRCRRSDLDILRHEEKMRGQKKTSQNFAPTETDVTGSSDLA